MGKAYLILENGAVFKGEAFGYEAETVGELVFTTGMNGFIETLTDPCYSGQIVVQTFPIVGNYGVITKDMESGTVQVKGYIVREWCQEPSNFRSEGDLDTFLRRNKVPGISGVDTRALTRMIRESGVMNAIITRSEEQTEDHRNKLKTNKQASAEEINGAEQRIIRTELGTYNAVLWDLGSGQRFIDELTKRGINITVMPPPTEGGAAADARYDGVIVSDGPGDPKSNKRTIAALKVLCERGIPIMGVGLGHQLLALARGAETEKLPFGHRGTNQTVRDKKTGKVFVTEQNHGYTVVSGSLPETAVERYKNCNDNTCEGIDYIDIPAYSVQFRPGEESEIYDRFIMMMEGSRKNAAK